MTTRSAPACFVIGHPISHSRSPLIHGHWLARHGIAGSYERIDVSPEALPGFINRIRAGDFAGGNVTLPHKQAVIPVLDGLTDAARAAGAVNTLFKQAGKLLGDNTDIAGFLNHLDASAPDWAARTQCATLLGAGGAARGIGHGLLARGVARLIVTNRSAARAQELVAALGPRAEAAPWENRSRLLGEADLVINTTSLGMKGQPPLEIELSAMRPGGIVCDIVYAPLETALLASARAQGMEAVDGLGMLLHQAAPGFARWFGVTPNVTAELRTLIEADILAAEKAG